jgi:hypothetical protein
MPRGHYLTGAVKDAIWVLRAEGVSEAAIGRRLGLPKRTVTKYLKRVSKYLERVGGGPAEVPSSASALPDARRA